MGAKVYLVGAGPGDPGLITVRGRELLARAQVLVYDAPCDAGLLVLVPADAERIPVGRWPDAAKMHQGDIEALLVDRARQGRTVVRLKNGDPYMFGRGGEEALALAAAGLEFEVVPGVTCGLAAAAWAGIPLTLRGLASEALFLIVQTGERPEDWGLDLDRLATSPGTLVRHLDPVSLGPLAAELVESAGTPRQRTFEGTLLDIGERARGARAPSVAFVGEAVRLRAQLGWAERRPLAGRAVVLTRPRAQAAEMASLLEEQGAEVIELPCIRIGPPESLAPLDRAIAGLASFDWVVFSSANGVASFLARLSELGRDARSLGRARLAAVGPATARALREARLAVDAVPEEFNAEALARTLGQGLGQGSRVLVVRAQEGREVLPEELERLGAQVEVAPAYRTVAAPVDVGPLRARLEEGSVAAVTFASPSAVKAFVAAFAPGEAARLLSGCCVAAIGPVTAKAASQAGLQVGLCPAESTGPALVEALVACLGPRRGA